MDPAALSFDFRPLWQMDAAASAAIALQKAQASQIYAGLGLWPREVMARLVEAQLAEDGTYPGAETIFAQSASAPVTDFDPAQPRDPDGRWTSGGGAEPIGTGGDEPVRRVTPPARSRKIGTTGTPTSLGGTPIGHAPDGTPIARASQREEEEETAGGSPPQPTQKPDTSPLKIVPNLLREVPGSEIKPTVYSPIIAKPIVTSPAEVTPRLAPVAPPFSKSSATPPPWSVDPLPQIPENISPGLFAPESIEAGPSAGPITQSIADLHSARLEDAHHVIQHAAVRDLPGYNKNLATGVQLEGPPTLAGSPHFIATQA